jgi:hypothetical protein
MRKWLIIAFAVLVFVLISGLLLFKTNAESSQSTDATTSQVLVNEIRELRRTLQDFTTHGYRVQIAIERVRIQQASVERLQGEIDGVEANSEINTTELQQVDESARTLERLVNSEPDPSRRVALEMERKNALLRVEECKKRELRLRERQAQLNASIHTEKAVLADLKGKVDEIDRSLENQK